MRDNGTGNDEQEMGTRGMKRTTTTMNHHERLLAGWKWDGTTTPGDRDGEGDE